MNFKRLLSATAIGAMLTFVAAAQSLVMGKDTPRGALTGRNIALWQSHGRYYDKNDDRWKWQRCRLFGTVEDLYTRSYVVPFLVPMLENAGAYVMLPRERDAQTNEVVIDDREGFSEHKGKQKWTIDKGPGFAIAEAPLTDGQNPFAMGTFHRVKSTKDIRKASTATWRGVIPERGEYAVYISYKTVDKSSPTVMYTVHTATGPREFTVDQTRGGCTWIYLGTFPFLAGKEAEPLVSISNFTGRDGEIVTADAVRIGGGMGSVARGNGESEPRVSGLPRWAEDARYYLQYAGMPDSVYASQGDDYKDDIHARPLWVNHLIKELNIPVDLTMAFHSDAGTTDDGSTVGTLGIYYTGGRGAKFEDGRPRTLSGALCDSIVSSVTRDIRAGYDPAWTRRSMRNAKYIEARIPETPTMLLELLSHQNMTDMRYGLDPQFKFDVSRAVYKGILRYLAAQRKVPYIVQPLAPGGVTLEENSPGRYTLSWKATADSLEPTAMPARYMIEQRAGSDTGEPFARLAEVTGTHFSLDIPAGELRSYRVIAVNDGGRSFPSEVVSAGHVRHSKGTVTVVNGFTRVSGPDSFDYGAMAGFGLRDPGVPMGADLSFTGRQYDYIKANQWVSDDRPGFGASRANHETVPVPGNTFDFAALHGQAIMAAGYSFVSSSMSGFLEGFATPRILDLMMGLQRETTVGTGGRPSAHQVFPVELQLRLERLAEEGVPMLLSGSYIASELQESPSATSALRQFVAQTFGYEWQTDYAAEICSVSEVPSNYSTDFSGGKFLFGIALGNGPYDVVHPDALYPVRSRGAVTVMRYDETRVPAGVAFAAPTHRALSLGFPFESIGSSTSRTLLMQQTLKFLTQK